MLGMRLGQPLVLAQRVGNAAALTPSPGADFVTPLFILSCSPAVTQGVGKTLLLYSGFAQKFHKFFRNSPNFLSFAAMSGLHRPPKPVE